MNKSRNILITIIMFLVMIGMGNTFILWFVSESLEDEIQNRLGRAVFRLEGALNHASQAAHNADELSGKPCTQEVVISLRRIVTTIPDVRTVNLVKENNIYCSSLTGPSDYSLKHLNYFRGQLLLLPGNLVTPSKSILVYRINKKKPEHPSGY